MINNPRTCPESLTHPLHGVRKISDQHDLGTGPLRAGVHAGETYDGVERGLLGYFVNASIENQFQFIMREWMNNYEFVGGTRLDPHAKGVITGTNNPGGQCVRDPPAGRRTPAAITGFGNFATTRAAAYWFLPSLTALRFIAGLA
jgi:hypothetical protein